MLGKDGAAIKASRVTRRRTEFLRTVVRVLRKVQRAKRRVAEEQQKQQRRQALTAYRESRPDQGIGALFLHSHCIHRA